MNKNKKEKKVYVPPTLRVIRIVLERNVTVQSPVQHVNKKDWVYETPESDVNNNADVWLNL